MVFTVCFSNATTVCGQGLEVMWRKNAGPQPKRKTRQAREEQACLSQPCMREGRHRVRFLPRTPTMRACSLGSHGMVGNPPPWGRRQPETCAEAGREQGARTGSPGQKPPRMLPGSSVGKAAGLKRLVNFRRQVRTSRSCWRTRPGKGQMREPWRQGWGTRLSEEELW